MKSLSIAAIHFMTTWLACLLAFTPATLVVANEASPNDSPPNEAPPNEAPPLDGSVLTSQATPKRGGRNNWPTERKEANETTPNVIVILADDMGIDSVSAFNDQLGMSTPAIDQLVQQGISFTDAHSTSGVCTPTRYGLLTGRYNWRSRLKRGIVGKWERPLIEDQRLTLPEMMKQHGYDTACIGKWHLGWLWPKKGGGTTEKLAEIDFSQPVDGGPNAHGFDYYFGDDVPNWPPYVWRENERLLGDVSQTMKQGAMIGVSAGPAVANWDFRAVLAEYGKRCSDFIRDRENQTQPFFLYIPLPSPHTPIAPHRDFQGKSGVSEYADFLIQTDATIKQIVQSLDEAKLAKDTVVFFTCDNGTSPKANFQELKAGGINLNANWRGWKSDAFEGGHRVPFVIRWPGQIPADRRSQQTITTADIMATCAEIVGHELPANTAEDSVSLLEVARNGDQENATPLHESVVHHSGSGYFAIRKGDWKLLLCHGSGGWSPPREPIAIKDDLPNVQLYNLAADPKESINLRTEHPEMVSQLTAELRELIEQGRSTPGPKQPNHGGKNWWKGLPWRQSNSD